jgi:hypothetical protein
MRRRLISLGLVVCLALALGIVSGVSVNAAVGVGIVIDPTPKTATVTQDFTVDIKVTNSGGAEVNSAGAHLNFDTTYLEVVSITPGTALGTMMTNTHSNAAGTIDYEASVGQPTNPPVTTDFVLATVTFHAKAVTAGTALTFVFAPVLRTTAVYAGGSNVLDPAAAINGNIIIVACETVLAGHVDLQGRPAAPNATWVTDLTVNFWQSNVLIATETPTTDDAGNFSVSGVTPGTYDICVKSSHALSQLEPDVEILACETTSVGFGTLREGDATGDDVITLADYSALYVAYGSEPGDGNWNPNCDFNENDAVDLGDYALLYTNYGEAGDCYVE